VFATTEGDLSDAQSVRLRERLTHNTECLGLYLILRNHEIRPIIKSRGQLFGFHELLDRHRCCRRQAKRLQLLRINLDVLVFGVLKTFDNVRLPYFSCLIDVLMMNTLMRLAIDLVELNLLARINGREDPDRDRNE
jgi:hypothetical protein